MTEVTVLLELLSYVLLLIYGTFLSIRFACGNLHPDQLMPIIPFFIVTLLVQAAVYFTFGYNACEKLYPVLTHLPLLLFLSCFFHVQIGISAIAIMISYFCCQPPLMAAAAAGFLTHSVTVFIVVHIISLLLFFFILYRHIGDTVFSLLQESRKSLLIFGILPAVYYIFDYVTTVYTDLLYDSFVVLAEFMPAVMVLFYIVFIALYHRQTQSASALEMDNLLLSTQSQQATKVIENLRETQQQAIRYRHDLRHHVSFLKSCLESGNTSKAIDYLSQVQDDIESITPLQICTNETANLIFSSFMEKTKQKNISFHVNAQIPSALHVSDTDLCSILSNCLENAMHACQDIFDPQQRRISCRVYIKNEKLCLDIRNTYAKKPVFVNGIPTSHLAGHGFGIKSIISIVEKYGGVFQFSVNEDTFIFQASI